MKTVKIVVSGVGGQGTLLASRLLAEAGIKAGLQVRIGETYGMSQRGGPVMGHVQLGSEAFGPLIRPGEADALLGFEIAEATRRGVTYLKNGGLAIVNSKKLLPVEVISGAREYPSEKKLLGLLGKVAGKTVVMDATKLAEEAGDPIATNMVMLGALAASGVLPYPEETIRTAMRESIPPRFLDLNMRGFELGEKAYKA